jgi:hypothetical protein
MNRHASKLAVFGLIAVGLLGAIEGTSGKATAQELKQQELDGSVAAHHVGDAGADAGFSDAC